MQKRPVGRPRKDYGIGDTIHARIGFQERVKLDQWLRVRRGKTISDAVRVALRNLRPEMK